MEIPIEKNDQYRMVLEITADHIQDDPVDDDEESKQAAGFVELIPQEVPEMAPHIHLDPEGVLVGRAFELAYRGYLIPQVISRWAMSKNGNSGACGRLVVLSC